MNIERPNIDRAMVSLFFEIKRNMPFEQRDKMKISSPNVGQQLISVYKRSSNNALKQLIEDFMLRAGDDWSNKLGAPKKRKPLFSRDSLMSRMSA